MSLFSETPTTALETVDIYVGPERKQYQVRKKALCEKLEYFDRFFSTGPKKVHSHDVDTEPGVFDLLVKWVDGGSLDIEQPQTSEEAKLANEATTKLIKLYGLAETVFKDITLMDDVFTAMYSLFRCGDYPTFDEMRLAYSVTGAGFPRSKLRAFMTSSFVWMLTHTVLWERFGRGNADVEVVENQHGGQQPPVADGREGEAAMAEETDEEAQDTRGEKDQTEVSLDPEEYRALTVEIEDLGKDVFAWLGKLALRTFSPTDVSVCLYHRHEFDDEGLSNCPGFKKFPPVSPKLTALPDPS